MRMIPLYTGGGVSFSPNYEEGRTESACVRLVADEGMMLVKGDIAVACVDVPRAEAGDWQDVTKNEKISSLEAANMPIAEQITINDRQFTKTYSDSGFYIERDGEKYSEAIDPADIPREYTETDIPVEADSNPEPDLTVSDTLEMLSEMGVDTDD